MTIGIYCIENTLNKKKYIGSSVNIEDRIAHHKSSLRNCRHSNQHLQRSWNKYGYRAFKFYILEICFALQLEEKENYYIEVYNAVNEESGYNKKWGFGRDKTGTHVENRPMLSQVKEKISSKLKGRPKSEEWKEKVRKPKDEKWKRKIGDSHLYKKLNIKASSSYVGVYYNKKQEKWVANIRVKGVRYYLGLFDKEKEAALRVDLEYRKHYETNNGINFKKEF